MYETLMPTKAIGRNSLPHPHQLFRLQKYNLFCYFAMLQLFLPCGVEVFFWQVPFFFVLLSPYFAVVNGRRRRLARNLYR